METTKRNLPRDVFLHLLAIVTLYWSAVSFVTLLWQNINYYLPDPLNRTFYQGITEIVRVAVSSLIIVFPVFILVSWYLNKIYKKESEVRESKIRKWLIYLTLFIAALVIMGDLIVVINIFLGGEITTRFILKALSVLLVAVAIFGYYLDDVRRETSTKLAKYFAWTSSILVFVVIISAFFIVGSPNSARLYAFDQQKIYDLQQMQWQIVNYYQSKEELPETLNDLNDPISSFMVPLDSQTNEPYEYNIKNAENLTFELCANFNRESIEQSKPALPQASKNENWQHDAERFCFERTIDRDLYPINEKTIR